MIITDEKILHATNENVSIEEGKEIIAQLEENLDTDKGVGLAAPQIGINKRVAIVRLDNENINLINPRIIHSYGLVLSREEGCLSIPDTYVDVYRFREIVVVDDLHPNGFIASGEISIVLQHEIDHLYSILMTDRAANKKLRRNDPCPCGRKENGKPVKVKKCHGK